MGLEKTRELPEGYSANYLRIGEFHFNKDTNNVSVTLLLYKDKISRDGGASFIGNPISKSFTLDLSEVLDLLYPKVKESALDENGNETNEFADAKDV